MIRWARDYPEARAEFETLVPTLSHAQIMAFLRATITVDRGEFCIQEGPDLINDPAGFGQSPEEAVNDFFSRLNEPSLR